jgi:hypothetical protein
MEKRKSLDHGDRFPAAAALLDVFDLDALIEHLELLRADAPRGVAPASSHGRSRSVLIHRKHPLFEGAIVLLARC